MMMMPTPFFVLFCFSLELFSSIDSIGSFGFFCIRNIHTHIQIFGGFLGFVLFSFFSVTIYYDKINGFRWKPESLSLSLYVCVCFVIAFLGNQNIFVIIIVRTTYVTRERKREIPKVTFNNRNLASFCFFKHNIHLAISPLFHHHHHHH